MEDDRLVGGDVCILEEVRRGGKGRKKYKKVKRDKVERPKHIKKDTVSEGTGMRMIGSGKKKGMG